MMRLIILSTLILLTAEARANNIIDLGPQRGHTVASIAWVDDAGRARQLSEFAGYPLILLPIYTRCHGACAPSFVAISSMKK